VEIELHSRKYPGLVALVDDCDVGSLSRHRWNVMRVKSVYRPVRVIRLHGKQYTILMSRQIMGLEAGDKRIVDHWNHDTLDHRRFNLRVATCRQNRMNENPCRGGYSAFKGVSADPRYGKWRAQIKVSGRVTALGYYADERLAAEAYNRAARQFFGEFACINGGIA